MNIRKLLLSALGLSAIVESEAFKPLPKPIALEATHMLNSFRREVAASNMQEVQYDFDAQEKLDSIINTFGATWMYLPYTGQNTPSAKPKWLLHFTVLRLSSGLSNCMA